MAWDRGRVGTSRATVNGLWPNDFGKIAMGGIGSGNWHRKRSYETVDAVPEFFAIDFKKPAGEVLAKPRDKWGQQEIAFHYLRDGQVILLFRSDSPDIDSTILDPVLRLDETPCNFGGTRTWLFCPMKNCGRRTQSLFISKHGTIGCRKCLGLLYESQYGGRAEKKLSRLRAIHRKMWRGGIRPLNLAQQAQQEFTSLIAELKKSTV
jgi:hypothetical protein